MGAFVMIRNMIYATALVIVIVLVVIIYPVARIKMSSSVRPAPGDGVTDAEIRRLYDHVEHLSVRIGSRSVSEYDKLLEAEGYIKDRLEGMGCPYVLQSYVYGGLTFSNIVVTVPGEGARTGSVVVGAHYDTVYGTPGADDNASAVAVLLELCRHLKDHRPLRNLKLVFFTLEEPPLFKSDNQGSYIYAKDARARNEEITAMICLEMLGYYGDEAGGQAFPLPGMNFIFSTTPNFIAVVGNLQSRDLVVTVRDSIQRACPVPVEAMATLRYIPGVDLSDHRSFWDMGYPAVMITDTAMYRNPNYHTPNDTIDTLDFQRMASLLKGLVQASKDLSGTAAGPRGD